MAFYGITFEPLTIEPVAFQADNPALARIEFNRVFAATPNADVASLFEKGLKAWTPLASRSRYRLTPNYEATRSFNNDN